ncbi:uncharacterized protein IL334_001346 [Kwoniella shivajii]|uniref:Zn(2)-C6 fungal-type domain-containing protein n=1 Tax=Kwoniella shivajii TaxID=564305 RepID=A0ABZ1CTA0_9TREE|nr:hypothetical protein IL334_001346 [Kwoniella shivajii]
MLRKSSSAEHDDSERGKVKRSRAVLVCHRCKSLKTRCDLGKPCSSCVKAKVEERCSYDPWRGHAQKQFVKNETPDPLINSDGPGPTTYDNRIVYLEDRLSRLESLLASGSSHFANLLKSPQRKEENEWHFLLSQLPPRCVAEKLLEQYFLLDTLMRHTHQPSYIRRFNLIYPKDGSPVAPIEKHMASYLASLCMALTIGTVMDLENSTDRNEWSSHSLAEKLKTLHHRFLGISESQVLAGPGDHYSEMVYYHLHSLSLRPHEALFNSSSSPPQTWFVMGEIIHTALFFGLHQDPSELSPELSPFWSEMRRRLWWLCHAGERIIIRKLRLPSIIPLSNVRQPVSIPDIDLREDITQVELDAVSSKNAMATPLNQIPSSVTPPQVENTPQQTEVVPEWTYIEAKINSNQLMTELLSILPSPFQPVQPSDIETMNRLVDQFDSTIPPHLRFKALSSATSRNCRLTAPGQPPWLLAQACVFNIGIVANILTAYQPYLSLPLDILEHPRVIDMALDRSLLAAHRLMVTAETFVWHITFRWPEGKSLFSWNLGSKIFSAGVTVALAAIRHGPSHSECREWMDDLTSAVGLLKVLSDHTSNQGRDKCSKAGSADLRALEILRQLSDRVRAAIIPNMTTGSTIQTKTDKSMAKDNKIFDPYTAHEMSTITPTYQSTDSTPKMTSHFGDADTFTLEDLEALLLQVYGRSEGNVG